MRMRLGFKAVVYGLMALASGLPMGARASVDVVQSVPLETNLAIPGIQDTQSAWLELINSAKQSIDLEEFYMSGADVLTPVVNALKAAATRGVQIRIILDKGFYKTYPTDAQALATVANVKVKTIDFSKLGGIMHAKYFVVDRQRAYVGSANFDWLALSHIQEVGLKVDDQQLGAGLESVFNLDWASGQAPSTATFFEEVKTAFINPLVQLYASPTTDVPADVPPSLNALLNLMKNAKSSLKIQLYEYSTSLYGSTTKFRDLDNAIRAAALRGVKVEMALDKTAQKAGASDLLALSKIANISIKTITIPQWSGGALQYARVAHSKYMIVDDTQVWIGSENWSGDYFSSSRNVGIISSDNHVLSKIAQIFNKVWTSAYVR